jgi:hypothetical protein
MPEILLPARRIVKGLAQKFIGVLAGTRRTVPVPSHSTPKAGRKM